MNPLAKKLMAIGNKVMSGLYRKSKGRVGGSVKGLPVLVLTVPGRKSGQPRSTPLAYFEHEGSYIVVGSSGGMKEDPEWIKNLAATDRAQIQQGDTASEVSVRIASGEERERPWNDVVIKQGPFFADYETKSGRTLKLGVLTKA